MDWNLCRQIGRLNKYLLACLYMFGLIKNHAFHQNGVGYSSVPTLRIFEFRETYNKLVTR